MAVLWKERKTERVVKADHMAKNLKRTRIGIFFFFIQTTIGILASEKVANSHGLHGVLCAKASGK